MSWTLRKERTDRNTHSSSQLRPQRQVGNHSGQVLMRDRSLRGHTCADDGECTSERDEDLGPCEGHGAESA